MNNPSILVADEDEDSRIILTTALRASGYDCLAAADGASALELARASSLALVVADLYMSCPGPAYLIETLTRDPTLGRVPVLAYAAYVFPRDRQRARELGCAGFIPKPATPNEVIGEIRRLVGLPSADGPASCSESSRIVGDRDESQAGVQALLHNDAWQLALRAGATAPTTAPAPAFGG